MSQAETKMDISQNVMESIHVINVYVYGRVFGQRGAGSGEAYLLRSSHNLHRELDPFKVMRFWISRWVDNFTNKISRE